MSTAGIKQKVSNALEFEPSLSMTMGQIMDKAQIPKTSASDVSSSLNKLKGAGLIKTSRGPSTSSKGPRYVQCYQWVVKKRSPVQRETVAPQIKRRVFNF